MLVIGNIDYMSRSQAKRSQCYRPSKKFIEELFKGVCFQLTGWKDFKKYVLRFWTFLLKLALNVSLICNNHAYYEQIQTTAPTKTCWKLLTPQKSVNRFKCLLFLFLNPLGQNLLDIDKYVNSSLKQIVLTCSTLLNLPRNLSGTTWNFMSLHFISYQALLSENH